MSNPNPPVVYSSTNETAEEKQARRKAEKAAKKAEKAGSSGPSHVAVKVPKGTRDSTPEQMVIREKAFNLIKAIFTRHGAVSIDTPVFELKETLTNKYGEDSKLIYDLADQGGEICALRYDLTVPFARFVAEHGIDQIKRYHIGRVYRRDQPAMDRGRYREFFQMDYDVCGTYAPMIPDSDCLCVLSEILDALPIGGYKIKVNHRKVLDAIMEVCGVPTDKIRSICSAIDKLDKEPWAAVQQEMIAKGLTNEISSRIGIFVQIKGEPRTVLTQLKQQIEFQQNKNAVAGLNDLELLFNYLECFGCLSRFSFDLSLARGLDYYTGVIYEAILTDTDRVGSIAAGGRYDNLIGMFSPKQIPAVGVSIGIERIFTILEEYERNRSNQLGLKGEIRKNATEVLVASVGKNQLNSRMQLCAELWKANINTEFLYDENPKPSKQIDFAAKNAIPFVVWTGEDEEKNGVLKIKNMDLKQEIVVKRGEFIETLRDLIKQSKRPNPFYYEPIQKNNTQNQNTQNNQANEISSTAAAAETEKKN